VAAAEEAPGMPRWPRSRIHPDKSVSQVGAAEEAERELQPAPEAELRRVN